MFFRLTCSACSETGPTPISVVGLPNTADYREGEVSLNLCIVVYCAICLFGHAVFLNTAICGIASTVNVKFNVVFCVGICYPVLQLVHYSLYYLIYFSSL